MSSPHPLTSSLRTTSQGFPFSGTVSPAHSQSSAYSSGRSYYYANPNHLLDDFAPPKKGDKDYEKYLIAIAAEEGDRGAPLVHSAAIKVLSQSPEASHSNCGSVETQPLDLKIFSVFSVLEDSSNEDSCVSSAQGDLHTVDGMSNAGEDEPTSNLNLNLHRFPHDEDSNLSGKGTPSSMESLSFRSTEGSPSTCSSNLAVRQRSAQIDRRKSNRISSEFYGEPLDRITADRVLIAVCNKEDVNHDDELKALIFVIQNHELTDTLKKHLLETENKIIKHLYNMWFEVGVKREREIIEADLDAFLWLAAHKKKVDFKCASPSLFSHEFFNTPLVQNISEIIKHGESYVQGEFLLSGQPIANLLKNTAQVESPHVLKIVLTRKVFENCYASISKLGTILEVKEAVSPTLHKTIYMSVESGQINALQINVVIDNEYTHSSPNHLGEFLANVEATHLECYSYYDVNKGWQVMHSKAALISGKRELTYMRVPSTDLMNDFSFEGYEVKKY